MSQVHALLNQADAALARARRIDREIESKLEAKAERYADETGLPLVDARAEMERRARRAS